ncbi:MAG: TraR/DksA C4-type zinc finger protein [Chitinophagales bacterium]
MGLSTTERAKIKAEIERLIKTCEADIVDLKEQCKPIAPENSIGRVSRMEAINSKSVAEAALRRTQNKLNTLKVAVEKIKDPNFGTCKRCGETIQAGRLMLMPDSPYCIKCA